MKNKSGKMTAIAWIAIAIVVVLLVMPNSPLLNLFKAKDTGGIPANNGGTPSGTTNICDLTQRATITGRGLDKLTGASANVSAEIWSKSNAPVQGEINVAGTTTISTNLPMNFEGYIFMGNDNYVSTTDVGAEYYYAKREVKYNCEGAVMLQDFLLAAEGNVTWTGYDDGASEAVLNVTVGLGQTLTSTELKFEASSKAYVGNPDFERPLAVCFNVTASEEPAFKTIKPSSYDSAISAPKFLSGYNIFKDCYVLPTATLKDYAQYRFGLVLGAETGQNPGTGGNDVYAMLLDKTYFKDDLGVWTSGFAKDSDLGTSTDIGMNTLENSKAIAIV